MDREHGERGTDKKWHLQKGHVSKNGAIFLSFA